MEGQTDRMGRSERVVQTPYGPYTTRSLREQTMSGQPTPARVSEQDHVEYRTLDRLPGYRVGSDGSVWSRRPRNGKGPLRSVWRLLSSHRRGRGDGHESITLSDGHVEVYEYVHRFVLEAFVGPCPPGLECRHLDGDRGNNRLSNLCWGTTQENAEDRVRHGTTNRGERHPMALLTEEEVRWVRTRFAAGVSQAEIARSLRVSRSTVYLIVHRIRWGHLE